MPQLEIDRLEHECIREELLDRREDDGWIEGNHEDHGLTTLTRRDGRFFVMAEELSFVRPIDVRETA